MSNIAYNRDIPNAPNNPSNDQPLMKINNNAIDSILKVDHHGFNDATNLSGFHTVIHQDAQTANPAPIAGPPAIGQTYTRSITPTGGVADVQLFYLSALGVATQLTGPSSVSATTNGYVYLPGGILMQWGVNLTPISPGSNTTFSQNFNINFPNGSFIVTGNGLYANASKPDSSGSLNIRQSVLGNKTKFDYQFYTNSSSYIGFTWFAIGN